MPANRFRHLARFCALAVLLLLGRDVRAESESLAEGGSAPLAASDMSQPETPERTRGTAAKMRANRFDAYAFMATYYDNNVFSYSDIDRQLYEAGGAAGGKYPIQDLGDVVTTLAARGDLRWDVKKYSMWRVRLMYDAYLYAQNTDRTNQRVGVSLQRLKRHSHASLTASYVPEYYLRHLYWRPMPGRPAGVRYAAAKYDKLEISAQGSTRLSKTFDGLLEFKYARRDYDYPFDERDNNTYSFNAGVDLDLDPRFDMTVLVIVDLCHAAGADSTAPAVADISNNRFGFEVDGRWKMNDWLRVVQTLDFGHQVYTTDKVTDLSHYDRTDDEFESITEFRMGPFAGWQPETFFEYRASSTTVPPGIAESGQYTAYRVGAQITYYF